MNVKELYRRLLRVGPPWKVEDVDFPLEGKGIEVRLAHRKGAQFPCPECGQVLPVYDHVGARTWRHLDSGPFRTWVQARIPRVRCLWHGTRQVRVPWRCRTRNAPRHSSAGPLMSFKRRMCAA